MGASTPGINSICSLRTGQPDEPAAVSIRTINRLFMLTLPAHLQINCGKALEPSDRDALRAKIIRSTFGHPS